MQKSTEERGVKFGGWGGFIAERTSREHSWDITTSKENWEQRKKIKDNWCYVTMTYFCLKRFHVFRKYCKNFHKSIKKCGRSWKLQLFSPKFQICPNFLLKFSPKFQIEAFFSPLIWIFSKLVSNLPTDNLCRSFEPLSGIFKLGKPKLGKTLREDSPLEFAFRVDRCRSDKISGVNKRLL